MRSGSVAPRLCTSARPRACGRASASTCVRFRSSSWPLGWTLHLATHRAAAAPGVLEGDRRTARDRGVGVASFVHYPARFIAIRKPAQLKITRSAGVERAHPTLLSTGFQRTTHPPVRHRRLWWPLRRGVDSTTDPRVSEELCQGDHRRCASTTLAPNRPASRRRRWKAALSRNPRRPPW